MIISSAEFIKSSASIKECPGEPFPEYAFLGRSNVGKSSLINMLLGSKDLAKTSGTPGKTRLINHFLINASWYLCDLPGYGFAKVSKSMRSRWDTLIKNYLMQRKNLLCSFILIDIRHVPQKNDMDFLYWTGSKGLPFVIVFTKSDKLSKTKTMQHVAAYHKALAEYWDPLPQTILSSSKTKQGREELLEVISFCNKGFDGSLV